MCMRYIYLTRARACINMCLLQTRNDSNLPSLAMACPKWFDVIPFKVYADNEWREFRIVKEMKKKYKGRKEKNTFTFGAYGGGSDGGGLHTACA